MGAKRSGVRQIRGESRGWGIGGPGIMFSESGGGGLEESEICWAALKFSEQSVHERIGLEKFGRRRGGGGTRWTSAGGEEVLICSSVTHQSALSDSESAQAAFNRGHKAQGQTNRTSRSDLPLWVDFSQTLRLVCFHHQLFYPTFIRCFAVYWFVEQKLH